MSPSWLLYDFFSQSCDWTIGIFLYIFTIYIKILKFRTKIPANKLLRTETCVYFRLVLEYKN